VNQLSFIIRYVPTGKREAVERFSKFIPNVRHDAPEDLYDIIIVALAAYGLKLADCRGQSYDNAPNVSGCYAGLPALLMQANALATYVPCSAHSLNLIGSSAVESIQEAANFFDFVDDFYNFFARFMGRWEVLLQNSTPGHAVVKRVTGTRWPNKYKACSALTTSFKSLMGVLHHIEDNASEKPENRSKAAGLRKNLNKFESVFMAVLWTIVLT